MQTLRRAGLFMYWAMLGVFTDSAVHNHTPWWVPVGWLGIPIAWGISYTAYHLIQVGRYRKAALEHSRGMWGDLDYAETDRDW